MLEKNYDCDRGANVSIYPQLGKLKIYRVSQKLVIELWRAIGHSIFNIQK